MAARDKQDRSWLAFLAMAFLVVGLCGVFDCFAAQLPLSRGLAHGSALDELATGPAPTRRAELRAMLTDDLNDTEAESLARAALPAARLAALHAEIRARFAAEARQIRVRLVTVTLAITATAALFGTMVASVLRS